MGGLLLLLIPIWLAAPWVYAAFQRPQWGAYAATALGAFGACAIMVASWGDTSDFEVGIGLLFMGWQIGAQTAVCTFAAARRPGAFVGPALVGPVAAVLWAQTSSGTRPHIVDLAAALSKASTLMLAAVILTHLLLRAFESNQSQLPDLPVPPPPHADE